MDICSSGDIINVAGTWALALALVAVVLGAVAELLAEALIKYGHLVRLFGLTVSAVLLGGAGAYLWLQVYAIQLNPGLSRLIDDLTVRLLCS
jgi:hypothetical protein